MSLRKFPIAVAGLGLLLCLSTSATAADFRLDHFKVYVVKETPVEHVVAFKGQFDREPTKVALRAITNFANPVSKNGEGILDKNAHLTWYLFKTERENPKRVVLFENQFGRQKVIIGQPRWLLVPTQKLEEGSEFPRRLDHYVGYEVLEGKSIGKAVSLEDQFGAEKESAVRLPKVFCVPVEKTHGDRVSKIINERNHLAVYDITPREHEVRIKTKDQFDDRIVAVLKSVWLCVPSAKIEYEEIK
jgi:hypothetical protein